jgi:hypothetical protein
MMRDMFVVAYVKCEYRITPRSFAEHRNYVFTWESIRKTAMKKKTAMKTAMKLSLISIVEME